MPAVLVEIKDKRFRAALSESSRRALDATEAWEECAQHMMLSVEETFEGGGRPQRWQKLSDGWAKRKPRNKNKTLVLAGDLKNSITYKAEADGLLLGSALPHSATHQFGRDEGYRGDPIPARPYIVVLEGDEEEMGRIHEDWLTEAMR